MNQEKLQELLALAEGPLGLEANQENLHKAEGLAKEAFSGYAVGIKDNIYHFALYKGTECVGASNPNTDWYNPNIDWASVERAVRALWKIQEKTIGVKLFQE